MVLALVTPGGSNFLKDWPAQNEVNCDLIDDYAGPSLVGHALGSYTPVLTASTTNPTFGTGGTLIGKYYRIFDQVWVWGEFRFGTGGLSGSGVYQISLPFRARTTLQTGPVFATGIPIGNGMVFDQSSDAGCQPVSVNLATPDYVNFLIKMISGAGSRAVTHVAPITWTGAPAPADGMMWSARYTREL